jgi:hypothetical protein
LPEVKAGIEANPARKEHEYLMVVLMIFLSKVKNVFKV